MFHFAKNQVVQKRGSIEQIWTISELLETCNPLPGEPLAERNAALQKACELAAQMPDKLSGTARLHLDFLKNFRPEKIDERTYVYKTSKSWELTINESGLFYKDVSGEYTSQPGEVSEQLFSDYWFFGPLRPMPNLDLRSEVLSLIKNTFSDAGCPASRTHFELFEYPKKSLEGLHWEEGNHVRRDYMTVTNFGIEMGYSTFRDGPFGPGFLSFEKFLNVPPAALSWILPEIRVEIERFLGKTNLFSPPQPEETPPRPLGPQDKMDASDALLKQHPDSEEGADMLFSLLEFEAETDYWRNYVFNRCFRLRTNPVVQKFIVERLRGDNELHFKKAVDVLMAWGMYGDKAFADRELLRSLNWEDATANDPDFRAALEKVVQCILQKN